MSQSPLAREEAAASELGKAYEAGWVVVHRMIRSGLSWSGRERNCMFQNTGGERFATISGISGIDYPDDARAMALVDWDRDGRLDMWVTNRSGPRLRLLLNRAPNANSFVQLKLAGKDKNRDAIGARVELVIQGETRKWIQTLRAGEGYLAQSSRWIHFGLPAGAEIERVSVRWPSGVAEEFRGVEPGKRWVLAQGAGQARSWQRPTEACALDVSPPSVPKESEAAHIVLAARPPFPRLEALTATGQPLQLAAHGRPLLALLWATWCAPCAEELKGLVAAAKELDAAGVEIVALSLDEEAKRGEALDFLKRMGWPFGVAFGGDGLAERFDVLQQAVLERDRRMPLPTSFLVDMKNELAVITKGPLSPAVLLADLARTNLSGAALRDAALPFPGRWLLPPGPPDVVTLARAFDDKGFAEIARVLWLLQGQRIETSKARILFEMAKVKDQQDLPAEAAQLFAQAVALEPAYFDARAALGYALHRKGELGAAIAAYRGALHIEPNHAPTIYNMALALFQNGEVDAARAQVEVLAAIDPATANELARILDRGR